MPLTIIRQDITRLDTDAIVNAANPALRQGGGVCGAIFRAAGAARMAAACAALSPIATGEAVVTPGFDLPAAYVIHAVGPVYAEHPPAVSRSLLRLAYLSALRRAVEQGCQSLAFPLLSSGVYGYPKQEALKVAMETIEAFLADHELAVYLAVFDREAFDHSRRLTGEVASYISEHYAQARLSRERARRRLSEEREWQAPDVLGRPRRAEPDLPCAAPSPRLSDMLDQMDLSFSEALLRLIDQKQLDDVAVYKRAHLTRQHFSKIRTGRGYVPGKRTALALAIAMELDLEETRRLLRCAGYALSHSHKGDVIVEYYIIKGIYDLVEINEMLDDYDQLPLGG